MKAELHPKFKKWKPRTLEITRKRTIETFEHSGFTNHSAMALTLPFIINYCEENKISYELTAHPGKGYFIKKVASYAD